MKTFLKVIEQLGLAAVVTIGGVILITGIAFCGVATGVMLEENPEMLVYCGAFFIFLSFIFLKAEFDDEDDEEQADGQDNTQNTPLEDK